MEIIEKYLKENKINIKDNVINMPYYYRPDKIIINHNKILNINIIEMFNIKRIIAESDSNHKNEVFINSSTNEMYGSKGYDHMITYVNFFDKNANIVIHHNYFILHYMLGMIYNDNNILKDISLKVSSERTDKIGKLFKTYDPENILSNKTETELINGELLTYLEITIDIFPNKKVYYVR